MISRCISNFTKKLVQTLSVRKYTNEIDEYQNRINRSLNYQVEGLLHSKIDATKKFKQFGMNNKSLNFMNAELNEIPNELKYENPFYLSTMDNGVRICNEEWDSPLVSIGIAIKAGSRNECPKTSGSAHFLEHLNFKGTPNRSRNQLEIEVENIGAHLNAYTSREITLFHIQTTRNNAQKALEILSDMILNSKYTEKDIDNERSTILMELEEVNKDYLEVLMENVYFNAFRNHPISLPILGDKDNIKSISRNDILRYHQENYIGPNIVVVGTGGIKHKELVEYSEKFLNSVKKDLPQGMTKRGYEKAVYTPAMMLIRDDETDSSHVGIFYDAPSWYHEDYYAFLIMERVFGTYLNSKQPFFINDMEKQYNRMLSRLAKLPDTAKQQAIFTSMSDSGIFGNYFNGNDAFTLDLIKLGLSLPKEYCFYIGEEEISRAKNKVYNELCQIESTADIMQFISHQVIYLNRRVSKSEIAARISRLSTDHIRRVFRHWILDSEPSITAYGPVGQIIEKYSYNDFKKFTY